MFSIPTATTSSATVEEAVRQKANRKMSGPVHCLPKTYASDRYEIRRAISILIGSGIKNRTHTGAALMKPRLAPDLLTRTHRDHQAGTAKIIGRDTQRVQPTHFVRC